MLFSEQMCGHRGEVGGEYHYNSQKFDPEAGFNSAPKVSVLYIDVTHTLTNSLIQLPNISLCQLILRIATPIVHDHA